MKKYLIDFVDNASDDAISAYLTTNQCTLIHTYVNLNKVYHVQSDNVPAPDSIVTSIIDDDESAITLLEVIPVPLPPVATKTETIDVHAEANWWKIYSMRDVDLALDNVDFDIYGNNVNVYIVDSGIDTAHPEFSGQNINLLYSFTGNFNDTNGHGTALSSVITGNTCGATVSSLNVVKIFDETQSTKQSDLLHAFDAILSHMDSNIVKVPVINLSWTISKNTYIEDKIRHLINAGALVVVSAGNSGSPIADVTPASMPEVLTVGSYGLDFVPSNFSNYSNPSIISLTLGETNTGALDSWAPGEQIWAAKSGGGYGFVSGTSIAAAIHTASLAYNLSRRLTESNNLPTKFYSTSNQISITQSMEMTARTGLLDLSDPKYSYSVNRICTFYNSKIVGENQKPKSFDKPILLKIKPNERASASLFNPAYVESYEWLTPLPVWAINEVNYLVLYSNTEPTDPSNADIKNVQLKLNLRDGSPSVVVDFTLAVVGTLFDESLLPVGDPILDLQLQANFGCDLYGVGGSCSFYQIYCPSLCNPAGNYKSCYCGA